MSEKDKPSPSKEAILPNLTSNEPLKSMATSTALPVGTPLTQPEPPQVDDFQKDFDKMIKNVRTGNPPWNTPINNDLVTFLEKYVQEQSKSKQVNSVDGANARKVFTKTLIKVIEKSDIVDFRQTWTIVLSFFWLYRKDAFHPTQIYKFSESWLEGDEELDIFNRLVNLIDVTADPATRSKAKQRVDLRRTLMTGFTDSGRNNILSFYGA